MNKVQLTVKAIEEGLNKKVAYSVSEGLVIRKPDVQYVDITIDVYENLKMHFYLVDSKEFPYHIVLQYDIPKDKCLTNDYESKLIEYLTANGLNVADIFSEAPGEVRIYLGFESKSDVKTAIEILKKVEDEVIKELILSIDDHLIPYYEKDLLEIYSLMFEDEDEKELHQMVDYLKKKYLSISTKKSTELVNKLDSLKKILVKGNSKSLIRDEIMNLIKEFEKEENV